MATIFVWKFGFRCLLSDAKMADSCERENSTFAPSADFYSTRQESAIFASLNRQWAKFSIHLLWKIAYIFRVEWRWCLTRVLQTSHSSEITAIRHSGYNILLHKCVRNLRYHLNKKKSSMEYMNSYVRNPDQSIKCRINFNCTAALI